MKTCCDCKISKNNSEFWLQKTTKDGMQSDCKKCSSKKVMLWKSLNPEARKRYHNNWRFRNLNQSRAGTIFRDIRRRSNKLLIPTDIDRDFILQKLTNGKCEITGIKFDIISKGRPSSRSPSLDRIVPKLGYIKSNVRMILFAMNTFKNEWMDKDIYPIAKEFCRYYEDVSGRNKLSSGNGTQGDPAAGYSSVCSS